MRKLLFFLPALLLALSVSGLSAQTVFKLNESFNSLTSGVPAGWDVLTGDASDPWTATTYGYNGTGGLWFNTADNLDGDYSCLKTPSMDLSSGNWLLTFRYVNTSSQDFSVYISTDGGATFTTAIARSLALTDQWTAVSYNITAAAAGSSSVKIVFRGESDWGGMEEPDGIVIDDVTVESAPTCQSPTGLYVTTASQTTATITWALTTDGDVPSAYLLTVTDAAGTAVISNQSIQTPNASYTITGLQPNTTYTVALTGDCSATFHESSSTARITFATLCHAQGLPYAENFDATTDLPACCVVRGGSLATDVYYGARGGSVCLSPTVSQGAYVAMPEVRHMASDVEVTLMIRTESVTTAEPTIFWAGLMTDPYDDSTIDPFYIDTLTDTRWHEIRFNTSLAYSPNDTTARVFIYVPGGLTRKTYIDNVSLRATPSCLRPERVTVSGVTATTATIGWRVANAGTARISIIAGQDTTYATATTNPYTVTGLTPNTDYRFLVRGICSATDSSDLSTSVGEAHTLCVAATTPLFTEGFETLATGSVPECWTTGWIVKPDNNTLVTPFTSSSTRKHSGTRAMTLARQATGSHAYLSSQLLPVDEAYKYQVSIWAYRQAAANYPDEGIKLWVNTVADDTVGGTCLGYIHRHKEAAPYEAEDGWHQYQYVIPRAGNLYVIVEGVAENGSAFYFDDLAVEMAPACAAPRDITVGDATTSTARIAWTPNGQENSWLLDYKVITAAGDTIRRNSTVVTGTAEHVITGLGSSVTYTVAGSVRAICSATDTSEARAFAMPVAMECAPISELPFFESFENTAFPPACWQNGNLSFSSNKWTRYSSQTYSAHGGYTARAAASGTGSMPRLSTPQFNFTAGEPYQVIFSTYRSASAEAKTDEGIVVYVGPNVDDTVGAVRLGFVAQCYKNAPAEAAAGVYSYTFDIPTTVSGANYVHFVYMAKGGAAGYVDAITVRHAPSCAELNCALSNPTASTITVTASDAAVSTWQAAYGPQGTPVANCTVTDFTGSNVGVISGLDPETHYDVYVRRTCGSEHSVWSPVRSIATLCLAVALPYTDDFEQADVSGYLAGCYTQTTSSTYGYKAFAQSASPTGPNATYNHTEGGSRGLAISYAPQSAYHTSTNATFDITNLVHLEAGRNYEIALWAKSYISSDGVVSDYPLSFVMGNDAANLTTIATATVNSTDFTQKRAYFSVTETGDYLLGFHTEPGTTGYYYAYLDDYTIREVGCVPPDGAVITGLGSTGATITLTGAGSAWDMVVSSAPIDLAGDITGDAFSATASASATFNITGLGINTDYYYTARTVCAGGESEWMTPRTFHTRCATAELPYAAAFDSYDDVSCWQNIGSTGSIDIESDEAFAGTGSLAVDAATVVSPELNAASLAPYMVSGVAYSATDSAELSIGIILDPSDISTFVPLGSAVITPANSWMEFTAYLTDLNDPDNADFAGARYVAFSTGSDRVLVDNLTIEQTPACAKPTNATIAVAARTVTVDWTDHAGAQSWVVRAVSADAPTVEQIATAHPFTLAGLSPATRYDIYVAAACSASDTSAFALAGRITTECAVIDEDYFENFEEMTEGTVPLCWDNSGTTSSNYAGAPELAFGVYTSGANHSLRMNNSRLRAGNVEIVTPAFALSTGVNRRLEFDYSHQASCGALTLSVRRASDAAYTVLDTFAVNASNYDVSTPTAWSHASIDLAAYAGDEVRFRFSANADYEDGAIFIDNIRVAETLSCADIAQLSIVRVGEHTADFAISDTAQHTAWQYTVVSRGAGAAAGTVTDITSTTFNVSGLASTTAYDIYVRAVCSAGNYSHWTKLSFATTAAPATVPYVCSFDNSGENDLWRITTSGRNAFVFGTDANAVISDGAALYVSADGCTNSYVYGRPSLTTASRAIELGDGVYNVEIDWQCSGGYGSEDFGRFYLAPATVDLRAERLGGYSYSSYVWPEGLIELDGGRYVNLADGRRQTSTIVNAAAGVYNLVFVWANGENAVASQAPLAIDRVEIRPSGCAAVTDAEVISTTTGSVSAIFANPDGDAIRYVVSRSEVAADSVLSGITHAESIDLSGLEAGTAYRLLLRRECSAADLSVWNTVGFNTDCAIHALPITEDFERADYPSLCWSRESLADGNSYGTISAGNWDRYTATGNSRYVHGRAGVTLGQGAGARALLISPAFHMDAQGEYFVRFCRYNNDNVSYLGTEYRIYVNTRPELRGATLMTSYPAYDRSELSGAVTTTVDLPLGSEGNYYVIFEGAVDPDMGTRLYLDDITIDRYADCRELTAKPTVEAVTATTATVSAPMGRQSAVQFGVAPYSANVREADLTATVTTADGHAVFTGLTAGTAYAVIARAICASTGDTTAWTAAQRFVTKTSDCFAPEGLHIVGQAGSSDAVIAWNAIPDATTALYTVTSGSATVATGSVVADTAHITGLSPRTAYTVSLSIVCQAGDTTRDAKLNFRTTGVAATVPYTTGFENSADNAEWSATVSQPSYLVIGTDARGVRSGSHGLYLSTDGSSYSQAVPMASATTYNVMSTARTLRFAQAGTYEVSFDWKCDPVSPSASNYAAYGRSMLVPAETAATVDLTAHQDGSAHGGAPGDGIVLVSRMKNQPDWTRSNVLVTIDRPCSMDLTFMWSSTNNSGRAEDTDLGTTPLAVDNVSVSAVSCMPVSSLETALIADSSLAVTVTLAEPAALQYAVTTTADVDATTTVNSLASASTEATITVTGLQPQTVYYVHVRTVCGAGDTSSWRTIRLSTTAVPAVLPYICTFEDNAENAAWQMINTTDGNYFVTGTAVKNGGSRSLYVTNDGNSYAYTECANSLCYAARTFFFEPGSYQYSYDVMCGGEDEFDFGRLFLAPASQSFTANVGSSQLTGAGEGTLWPTPRGCVAIDGNTHLSGINAWTTRTGSFVIAERGSYNLMVGWANDYASGTTPIAVDNIEISAMPCAAPQAVVTRVTTTGATVALSGIPEGTDVAYAVSHTTSIDGAFAVDTLAFAGTEATLRINGLTASQTYTLLIRSLCDDGASPWAGTSLSTACGTVTEFPYSEDFETMEATELSWGDPVDNADDVTDRCWYVGASSTDLFTQVVNGFDAINGDHSLSLNNMAAGSGSDWTLAALPEMDSIAKLRLSFVFELGSAGDDFDLGYLTDSRNSASFVRITSLTNATQRAVYTADLSGVPATARRIAFRYAGFAYAVLDDIRITRTAEAPAVADTICYIGSDSYQGYGFDIPAGQIAVGDNVFTRLVRSTSVGVDDTLYTLNLYMYARAVAVEHDTICAGTTYARGLWGENGGIVNPVTGTYTRVFAGAAHNGCDSAVTLYLEVLPVSSTVADTICAGASYTFGDTVLTTTGTYVRTYVSARGCTVTDTLLLVAAPDTVHEARTICAAELPYAWRNLNITAAGTYHTSFVGLYGCAQTAEFVLTVIGGDSTVNVSFCAGGSVQVVDTFITTPGTYTLVRVNARGCDVTYHITAAEEPVLEGRVADYVCEGSLYYGNGINGLTVTADTVVTVSTRTASMCDSITYVSIRFVPTVRGDVYDTITAGETYDWNDETLTEAGSYPATFRTAEGCDSVVTLHLSVLTGVDNAVDNGRMRIVPNPAAEGQSVLVVTEQTGRVTRVELINSFGATVDSREPQSTPIAITAPAAAGVYYVRITTAEGRVYVEKLIVR